MRHCQAQRGAVKIWQQRAGKLDLQEAGVKAEGRKPLSSGAKARLYCAVREMHLPQPSLLFPPSPSNVLEQQSFQRL